MSRAGAGSPHGKKLYHLYVSDPIAYALASTSDRSAPVGLTLIKESHIALNPEVAGLNARSVSGAEPALVPGAVTDLFVMMKIGNAGMAETDAGWVYATASPQGEIESIGMIESCIRCHEQADHDRLFGLAPATTVYFMY